MSSEAEENKAIARRFLDLAPIGEGSNEDKSSKPRSLRK